MKLTILYRGPLHSCNYACPYCPFAKSRMTRAELQEDAVCLARFVDWVAARREPTDIFFTPWGEALIHENYRQALIRLSHLPHVKKVAIQTNLSCSVGWVKRAERDTLALWSTWHPGQVPRERFLAKCHALHRAGCRYSVGIVGLREHLPEIAAMRQALPEQVYLWVNAFKRDPDYYSAAEIAQLGDIDPLFRYNLTPHPSLGRSCATGESVISVDGEGTIRRCHFIDTPLGNLYADNLAAILAPRPCSKGECRCHIGYVHMPHLGLQESFGDGILERIPLLLQRQSTTTH